MSVTIASEAELIDQMTTPTPEVEAAVDRLDGEILLLGVGGKMGPSLAELLVRAGARQVLGVSRFSDPAQRRYLEDVGVETIACDLLDPGALKQLPDARNIFLLAGFKFGATGNEDTTWAMNTWLPGRVLERYADARIIYVSSGNVYAYADYRGPGAAEDGALDPVGEYAQSRLGGERVASYAARVQGTPLLIVRLFYATELRYGIVHDIAWKVWTREPIDLAMGLINGKIPRIDILPETIGHNTGGKEKYPHRAFYSQLQRVISTLDIDLKNLVQGRSIVGNAPQVDHGFYPPHRRP